MTQVFAVKNRTFGLTGVLVFVDETFIQILEGPPANVEEVFEQICCDLRHTEVELIETYPVQSRLFAEWDMAFLADGADISDIRMGEIRQLLNTNSRMAEQRMRQTLLDSAR